MSFVFGGNTGLTYEDVQSRRKIAENMRLLNATTPQNVGEGVQAIARALVARGSDRTADKADNRLRGEFNAKFDQILGGGAQPAAVSTRTVPQGAASGDFGDLFASTEAQYGLPSGYLARTAEIESAMDPRAQNPNSSAGGLFQFIDGTAADYGLSGDARFDPAMATDAAARLASDNARALRNALGREPTAAELYLAHQQGAGGASKLLSNPNARAVDIVGADAVRLNGGNENMTAADFAGLWTGKFGGDRASTQSIPAQGAPDMTRIASMANLAASPYANSGQQAVLNALIQRSMPAPPMSPLEQIQLQQAQVDLANSQRPEPGYTQISPKDAQAMGLDPAKAYQRSPDGKISQIGGGGVTVNNLPQGAPEIGTIPQGYEVFLDAEGNRQMRAIPGGPEDTSENDAVADANRDRSGMVVTEDISKALSIIEESPRWTTGLGAVLKRAPGTQAKSLDGLLTTIKANVGFDRLQQMRDASPTGGALGAINKTEMDLLQSVLGNLDQSLSAEDLERNLLRVNDIYLDIIHGPGNRPDAPTMDFSGMDAGALLDMDLSNMTAEQLQAYMARMDELGL